MIKSKCNIIMNYNVEWYILLKCAICEMDDEVEELIKNNAINWGELIEQAMRHKLLPMLSHYLTNEKIFDYLPPFINQYFGLIYTINMTFISKKQKNCKIFLKKIVLILLLPKELYLKIIYMKIVVIDSCLI